MALCLSDIFREIHCCDNDNSDSSHSQDLFQSDNNEYMLI